MKYKPCCDRRCLKGNCQTRDHGGCYCVCRIIDAIGGLELAVEGRMVAGGSVYIPDTAERLAYIERHKAQEIDFRENVAPQLLRDYKNKLKEYYIRPEYG